MSDSWLDTLLAPTPANIDLKKVKAKRYVDPVLHATTFYDNIRFTFILNRRINKAAVRYLE